MTGPDEGFREYDEPDDTVTDEEIAQAVAELETEDDE